MDGTEGLNMHEHMKEWSTVMKKEGRAMKRFLFLGALGVGSAALFAMSGVGPASADAGPHTSTSAKVAGDYNLTAVGAGRCAGCHRTHTAKGADLLKAAQPALCYTCHATGMGAATDVANGVDQFDQKALRGGGFNTAKISGGAASKHMEPPTTSTRWNATLQNVPVLAAPVATTSRHEIDGTTSGTMWGNGAISATVNVGKASVTLECGSCHDPHGNGNYRILKPVPVDAATTAVAAKAEVVGVPAVLDDPATTTVNEAKPAVVAVPAVEAVAAFAVLPVVIPDAGAKVYTTANYWNVGDANVPKTATANSDGTFTDGYIANASQWCSTCHSRYLAKAPDYKTDSGDGTFTYRHTSGRIDKAGVGRPNCIQCHVSHGSNAAMVGTAATYDAPDGTVPVKTSRLLRIDNRGVCVMCHNV